MERPARKRAPRLAPQAPGLYGNLVGGIAVVLEAAHRTSARTVNAVMTATYWEIGRRIVEYEQGGKARAEYGKALLERLASDLTTRFGRGFPYPNLNRFRQFYRLPACRDSLDTVDRIPGPDPPGVVAGRRLGVKNEHARGQR